MYHGTRNITLWRTLAPALKALTHIIFPPECSICHAPAGSAHALCGHCWKDMHFISGPICINCGLPSPEQHDLPFCDGCPQFPPFAPAPEAVFQHLEQHSARIRAPMLYEGKGREMVLALKHADRLSLAHPAALWMARSGRDLLATADILVPVPLHWRRRLKRRGNQAAELSRRLARITSLSHQPDALVRKVNTQNQKGRDREARMRAVAKAFEVPHSMRHKINGKRIILVDDVVTSGATIAGCATKLLEAGAQTVDALAMARVAPREQETILADENEGI